MKKNQLGKGKGGGETKWQKILNSLYIQVMMGICLI